MTSTKSQFSISSINNSKIFCPYNICGQNIFSCRSLLNTKVYMLFRVGQKYHKISLLTTFCQAILFFRFFSSFFTRIKFFKCQFWRYVVQNKFRGKGRNSISNLKSFHSKYLSLTLNGPVLIIFFLTLELSILMGILLQLIQITL